MRIKLTITPDGRQILTPLNARVFLGSDESGEKSEEYELDVNRDEYESLLKQALTNSINSDTIQAKAQSSSNNLYTHNGENN